MTTVTFVSDTHRRDSVWSQIPLDTDVLVHCGDFSGAGTSTELTTELHRFSMFPHPEKFFVYGNHDRAAEYGWPHPPTLTRLVETTITTASGLTIWGSQMTPEFNNWAFGYPRMSDFADLLWSMIPENLDILVTHGPPHGVLDVADGKSLGCEVLRLALSKLRHPPKVHAFGHVHEGVGTYTDGNTTYINTASRATTVEMSKRHPLEVRHSAFGAGVGIYSDGSR